MQNSVRLLYLHTIVGHDHETQVRNVAVEAGILIRQSHIVGHVNVNDSLGTLWHPQLGHQLAVSDEVSHVNMDTVSGNLGEVGDLIALDRLLDEVLGEVAAY